MGDKNIKKEVKKMKKSDKKGTESFTSAAARPVSVQPVLIKKEKKAR